MFTGVTLPFTPADLVGAGNELLGLVGTFVLLGMAFVFVPKIIRVIREAFQPGSTASRDEYGNRNHYQSAEAKAHRDKFYKEKGWKI